ncbi:hypothetical protein DMUE_6435, partial [Dictyocoela muelleri]
IFKNIKVKHCLFHFGQSIWRKIQNTGLSNLYKNNKMFRFDIKKILALTFINTSRIYDIYNLMINELKKREYYFQDNNGIYIDDFLFYFKEAYLEKGDFTWSSWESVLFGIPLTTNTSEAYNRGLNHSISSFGHPSLVKFIIELRKKDYMNNIKKQNLLDEFIKNNENI